MSEQPFCRQGEPSQFKSVLNAVPIRPLGSHVTARMDRHGAIKSDKNQTCSTFDEMNLNENLLRGIYAARFEKPWALQRRAIMPCLTGCDVIVAAQAGAGKTATFLIAILQNIVPDVSQCQALILTPTREVAQRVEADALALGVYLNVSCRVCVGGTAIREDQRTLESGVQIVIGTPGRVYNMIDRGSLKIDHIKMFVLDEADEIMSRGTVRNIVNLVHVISSDAQKLLFSCTVPLELYEVASNFMRDPVKISITWEELILNRVTQYYVSVEKKELKLDTVCDLYDTLSHKQNVIFCNSPAMVDWLAGQMREKGRTVSSTNLSPCPIPWKRRRHQFHN
ncbi:ATP-dependent RNA helicase eIF4A isoform X2 [Folsomia candida]|uniref:ATP-dependent RNA helicase eIF4A isoform X2 n=1 Tax=Folsomia candida TaxID=158441 RepID=UPI000B8F5C29|nr:ATP-dependent RNA helicase eIF4A isoform X2 [Folsomia candida]